MMSRTYRDVNGRGRFRPLPLVAAVCLACAPAFADDGGNGNAGSPFQRSMTQHLEPGGEAEHAFIEVINQYVPAQAANGDPTAVEHYNIDGGLEETLEEAKPQIGAFIYGPVEHVEGNEEIGFVGHGLREAYAAISLDDGATWKTTNLSRSADRSSIDLERDDIALYEAEEIEGYPGDVVNVALASDGNRVIAAWPSRFCDAGQPNYALASGNPERRDAIADYLGIDLGSPSQDDLYLTDMYGVAGQQASVDYAEDPFEKNQIVGEVPFNCLWSARGTLEMNDDGTHDVTWRSAERLTSGRRDVYRVEVDMVDGAGAVITWQEDPEGLRPGQGLGPGAGWSGAVANAQTDVWYSFIEWEHFDLVQQENAQGEPTGEIVPLAEYAGASNRPQVGIPMAMPMRLTDNARCNVENPLPYCNGSAISAAHPDILDPLDYGMKDMCADTVEIPTGPMGTLSEICVTENGLPLVGNIASTRPVVGLFGYDSNRDGEDDSAWVVLQSEESKGLGRFEDILALPRGKNMWYYTFSMSLFDDRTTEENRLVANLSDHGNMLNQPAVDWMTGAFYPVVNTADLWNFGDYDYDIYETEIARRGSLIAQPASQVSARAGRGPGGKSGLTAFPLWKQGQQRQGGPADVMARRIVLPNNYQEGTDNPYAFTNMDCDNLVYADGSNPYYPDGLCLDTAINLSSVTPDECVDTGDGTDIDCPSVDPATGIGDTNPILQGADVIANTQKVLTWHQCPNDATLVSSDDGLDPVLNCEESETNRADNFTDQSWYNPLDVAKGHRGFVDGDFLMVMYAWSPNWKLNSRGTDRYELYIRRSFDGGETWTTLPKNYVHLGEPGETPVTYKGEGTVDCESFRIFDPQAGGDVDEPQACFSYDAAGAGPQGAGAQQARNVSQLKSMRFTILDPRYSPTAPSVPDGGLDDRDIRDPSRYFIVYETGDNSTVEFGEAEPLNLYYSRGVSFGDHYQVWAEEEDLSVCYPSDPHDDPNVSEVVEGSGFCNEFDALEGRPSVTSSEASLAANPGGEWLYGVWTQADETSGESDAMWRRVWYIDDYISTEYAWDVVGQGQQ